LVKNVETPLPKFFRFCPIIRQIKTFVGALAPDAPTQLPSPSIRMSCLSLEPAEFISTIFLDLKHRRNTQEPDI